MSEIVRVIPFDRVRMRDLPEVGGKNASLGEMIGELAHAGIRVQPLARYCAGVPRRNGLLLGYSALSERRIGAGVARLARVLHRLGPGRPRPT